MKNNVKLFCACVWQMTGCSLWKQEYYRMCVHSELHKQNAVIKKNILYFATGTKYVLFIIA